MDHPTPQDLLRVPLFADLTTDAAEVLARHFGVEQYEAGRKVMIEGSPGYAFYILDAGQLAVTHGTETLRTLGPGDFFGEIAILGAGRRTATVTATEPVTTWKMFGTAFRELERARPDVAAALQQAMRLRLGTGQGATVPDA
jgi:CRP/FNR family transcriptional regulator, cyclic AMP receptor protein